MKSGKWLGLGGLILAAILFGAVPVFASPWAQVGDNQLRGDIEILSAAGLLDDVITTHWPLPWQSIVKDLGGANMAKQPSYVRAAAARVMAQARGENDPGLSAGMAMDFTTMPSVVYGFDGMGRGDGATQFILDYNSQSTAARLQLGGFSQNFGHTGNKIDPDQSYLAEKLGPVLFYGGYISHWWGPGWISALALSDNARPMPAMGLERLDTSASHWPVLRWLGPWQMEFFIGLLDGPRLQPNTFYNALRISTNPFPGFEFSFGRTEEFCGQGHPCVPIRDYLDIQNSPGHSNNTNDEGFIDFKYNRTIAGVPAQIYLQVMNEDTSPFVHSETSHLFGASVFLPAGLNPLRLTIEYASSISTVDILSFGDLNYGISYTNVGYPDGMRYRDRTIGFSLDDDSTLLSLQGAWTDPDGRFYELSFHHADISNINSEGDNILTPVPRTINLGEVRVTLPFRHIKIDLARRLQDDQLPPHSGFAASFEAGVRVAF